MARDTCVYSLARVAMMIGENPELIEVVAANPDNIDYGEMIHVHDGTEEGITAFTARGIESLKELLADVRSWTGGLRQFLVDQHCEPDQIERIMADQRKR
jgi:hypothetical protein